MEDAKSELCHLKTNGEISEIEAESDSDVRPVSEDQIVRINISGFVFETLDSTLKQFPNTLLGNEKKRQKYYIKSRKTYFFDRNRASFEAILYFYQTGGVLIRPPTIPMKLFAKDVLFFKLGGDVFDRLRRDEGYLPDSKMELPENRIQRAVWELFECPDTSLCARLLAIWSVIVIIFSIAVFCIETLPEYKRGKGAEEEQPWFSFEIVCITWFTVEYLVRFAASPNKFKFLKSFLNLIDLAAILPYFITLPMDETNTAPLSLLRVIRLVRVFRIFKLSRHSTGLQILGYTLRESSRELAMLMFFLILGIILFSSAVYYAEMNEKGTNFQSIPHTFWYSLVTMTTVGYGDIVPQTLIGKMVGSLCAIVGVLTIALPVPVIVSNFEFFYKRDRFSFDGVLTDGKSEEEEKPKRKEYECLLETNV